MNMLDQWRDRLLRQCPRPFGLLGEYITFRMNRRHYPLTTWGLSQTTFAPDAVILDIGCGGGRTVQRLAALAPRGKVCGVDISDKSVAVSSRLNRAAIREGRVAIRRGSVACLPYPDATFDRVVAVETHYFWPSLPANLAEVLRALKPGGQFLLVAEVYRSPDFATRNIRWVDTLNLPNYSVEEFRALFEEAGFDPVAIHTEAEHGWICCVGERPAPAWTV